MVILVVFFFGYIACYTNAYKTDFVLHILNDSFTVKRKEIILYRRQEKDM